MESRFLPGLYRLLKNNSQYELTLNEVVQKVANLAVTDHSVTEEM